MTSTISLAELKAKLEVATSETQRRLYFAALLRGAAGVPLDDFCVVGGSAVEVYSVGEFTSGDIDLVSESKEKFERVLEGWGFKRRSTRTWSSSDLRIFIELLKAGYEGNFGKTTLMPTPFGPVRLAAIEDLLVKRLSSVKHWRRASDLDHAKYLALEYFDRIDWAYVERFAGHHDVAEMAAELHESAAKLRRKRAA
jgi:hypothetical protein